MRTPNRPSIPLSVWMTMWAWAFWDNAYGQATTRAAGNTTTPTSSVSISIVPLPTLTSCGSAILSWAVTGEDVGGYSINFYALGASNPSSSAASQAASSVIRSTSALQATSAASTAITRPLSERAAADGVSFTQPATAAQYTFVVTLPPGRYYFHGKLSDPLGTGVNSQLFNVVAGNDTSCLTGDATATSAAKSAVSSSTVSSVSSVKSSTAAASTVGAGSAATSAATSETDSGDGKSGFSGGAIAGVAIAAIAVIVLILSVWFFCVRRRKRQLHEESAPSMRSRGIAAFGKPFAGGLKKGEHEKTSKSASGDHRSKAGHIALTSLGGSSDGHEKYDGPFAGGPGSSDSHSPAYLPQVGVNHSPERTPTTPRSDPFATAPPTPMGASEFGIAMDNDLRRSQSPMQSPVLTSDRSRSNSQPSEGPSGKVIVKRNVSARRKPVPSLGAELRDQLRNEDAQRQTSQREGQDQESMSRKETLRASYQLMPDLPKPIHE